MAFLEHSINHRHILSAGFQLEDKPLVINFKPFPLLVAEGGMDGKKQFSNSGWQATQCCLGQSESQIKSWSNCHPKMVGTNHLSVEDVQIDKACVFQQKIITLWSFNHSSQIKPKYFPETKTLAYQFFYLKEIFVKIIEHSHEWTFDGGKHGGGSGRNDALREYYIQLCNKWTQKIVFWGKNYRVGDFFVLRFSSIKCGGVPPLLR